MQSPPEPPDRAVDAGSSAVREAVQRWRLVISRDPRSGSQGQRELVAAWDAALLASGLPIAGLDALRPKPRFVLAAPLGSAVGGEAELADLWLVERLPRWRVREALSPNMPIGHALIDLYNVWLGEPALPGRVAASLYRLTVAAADAVGLARAAAALLDAETLPRDRRKGDSIVSYDLRPFLAALEVRGAADGAEIRMTLVHDPARGIGRPDEVLAALAEAIGGHPIESAGLVRERLILAEPAPPEAPVPKGPRHPPSYRPGSNGGSKPARNR